MINQNIIIYKFDILFNILNEIIKDFDPLPPQDRSEEEIYMLYTGGTTGMPKGVMYKQGEFLTFLFRTLKAMGYDVPEDINNLEEQIHNFKKDNKFVWTFASYDEETFSDRNVFPIGCIKELKKIEI